MVKLGLVGLVISWLTTLSFLAWIIVLAGFVTLLLTLYGLSRQKPLQPSHDKSLCSKDAPLVSILVPVRNEKHPRRKEESVPYSQDYGCFEGLAATTLDGCDGRNLKALAERTRV